MNCVICNKEFDPTKEGYANTCSIECFEVEFWNEKVLMKDEPNVIRINHEHYIVGEENSNSGFKGYGGARFDIIKDGQHIVTHNLWSQGTIPPEFYDRLPDNATWFKEITPE